MNHHYYYNLPAEKIAVYPAQERSHSKLLVFTQNQITDTQFSDLCSFLPEHALLIRNTSRVIKARLFLKRKTGGIIEVFCLNFNQKTNGNSTIECLIKNVRKLSEGEILSSEKIFNGILIKLTATYSGRKGENCLIEFRWEPENFVFLNILDIFGEAPLPPYIKRKAEAQDAQRYQTIYAHENGSVAAPTAGLHFTEEIESQLQTKNIATTGVVLHVGLGTFQPMKVENLNEHIMHEETFSISAETLHLLHAKAQNTNICVGTTSLRTIESMYIAAHFINESSDLNHINVGQWDYQHINKFMSRKEAWEHLMQLADKKNAPGFSGDTSLMITPDYHCKTTDMLITNFHQPDSTLLLIVASFIGTKWREVYDHALNNNYRFLSYGDACLFKNDKL